MSTQVTVNNVRLAYMHLIEPHAAAEGAEPKYSVTMIIPKANADAVSAVKNAMVAARDLKWGKGAPKGLRSPLRDGDEKDDDGNREDHGGKRGCAVVTVSQAGMASR